MFWIYAATGSRTRVRDYFPAIVNDYKSRWEASVIATGPQPQFGMLNNGSSDILFMVLLPKKKTRFFTDSYFSDFINSSICITL